MGIIAIAASLAIHTVTLAFAVSTIAIPIVWAVFSNTFRVIGLVSQQALVSLAVILLADIGMSFSAVTGAFLMMWITTSPSWIGIHNCKHGYQQKQ